MEQLWGPSISWKGTFEETISSTIVKRELLKLMKYSFMLLLQ